MTIAKKIVLILLACTGFAFGIYLLVGAIKTVISILYITSQAITVSVIRRVIAGLLLVTLRVVITLVLIFPYSMSLLREAFPDRDL